MGLLYTLMGLLPTITYDLMLIYFKIGKIGHFFELKYLNVQKSPQKRKRKKRKKVFPLIPLYKKRKINKKKKG